MDIAQKIKDLRKEKGLTQKQLADRTGLATITIQNYEGGKYKPKIETMLKIADALNVEVEILLGDNGYKVIENYEHGVFESLIETSTGEKLYKLRKEEDMLLDMFNQLNEAGKNKALEYTDTLVGHPKYKKRSEEA